MRKVIPVVFALAAVPAWGQFTSNIQGTVTDSSGAVVPGAVVTLTNTDTNVQQMFTTNGSGQYYFNRLAPGPYRIEVKREGFASTVREQRITTEQTAGIDLQLGAAGQETTVNVTSDLGHGINPDETRTQYTLSAREIEEFPLQNRSTLGLLRVAPGATGVNENTQNISVNRATAAQSVNGRSNAGNIFLLDFIPINSELGGFTNTSFGSGPGAVVFVPHTDMIEEIALETTTYSVENTAGSGLQSNITSKSGSNKFHGDLDYTYTGTPFVAHAPLQTVVVPFRKQFVEGSFGGPIWKDKTFFFGSYFNQQTGSPAGIDQFADPAFVAWAKTNYPNSLDVSQGIARWPADQAINPQVVGRGRDQGAFNTVDFSSPACGTTGGAFPTLPCDLPVVDQAQIGENFYVNGAQYNFRLDHSLREGKDKVYASFFRFDQKSNSPKLESSIDGFTPSTGYYLAGNYTHTFSQNLVNLASFGQTRFYFDYGVGQKSANQVQNPFFAGCTCGPRVVGNTLNVLLEHQTYGRDAVTWTLGRHNFNFGFQGSLNNELQDSSLNYDRPFFESEFFIYDFLNDKPDLYYLYALSAQNGQPVRNVFGAGGTRFGAYAQDSWKVTPNLLISYGIRWDDFGNPAPYGKNALAYANVFTPGYRPDQIAGASTRATNSVYASRRNLNFLPRGAFAYSFPGTGQKTVLRGGVGLYDDDLTLLQVANNLPTQAPVRLTISYNVFSPSSQGVKPIVSYGNTNDIGAPGNPHPFGYTFPTVSIYGYNAAGAPLDQSGNVIVNGLNGTLRDLKPQKAVIYSLGLEQELPKRLVIGLNYAGSYGYDNLIQPDANTYNGLTGVGNNVRYNPNFSSINLFRNQGTSNYNALIATARQSIGTLTYQASYTWGKSLSTPIESFTDQQNINSQYTIASGDIRNRLSVSQVYEVPAHFNNFALNKALSGWSINNVLIAQSGGAFTVADTSGNENQDGVSYDVPLYSGTQRSFSRSEARKSAYTLAPIPALNPNAFFFPAYNQPQGLQNTFRGPGYFTLDTGFNKKILFPWFNQEHATLALRGEFTNILNRANFGGPSGNLTDGTLGRVTSASQARQFQFGGRFQF